MEFLYEKIKALKELYPVSIDIPRDITDNLSENIQLRPYQIDAFKDTLFYLNSNVEESKKRHLLYHMATGSGKTVLMAMNILYYYTKGYRNFLFFTQQTSIVSKTRINFTNKKSSKYLFSNQIVINGNNIDIKIVDSFQNASPDSINICFNTIAGIHSTLWTARENSIGINDFKEQNVVMIADEAHHFNSSTKKNKKAADEERSWEDTVNAILHVNSNNKLLEFTATCDKRDPGISAKYCDKIIVEYTLKEFRKDRYTKDFYNYPRNCDSFTRVLQALILSEYRRAVFDSHNVYSKPIVMVKSKLIEENKGFYAQFYENLKNLTNDQLIEIKNNNQSTDPDGKVDFIKMAFDFFEKNGITVDQLRESIQLNFSKEHAILMSEDNIDTDELNEKVNTLDDYGNPYRIIFTVDKLTEGWDVLSLFDIVRVYEDRQSGTALSEFTIKEAQLIGRGARYFPFVFEKNQDKYRKKYDNNTSCDNAICETLIYHCMFNSRYIAELTNALRKEGIEPEENEKIPIAYHLKKGFKDTEIYKNGLLFFNERNEVSREEVKSLPERIRNSTIVYECGNTGTLQKDMFEDQKPAESSPMVDETRLLKNISLNISSKALRMYSNTLSLEKLHEKLPNLTSLTDFIISENYLGNATIILRYPEQYVVKNIDWVNACKKVFGQVSDYVSSITIVYKGTDVFNAHYVHDILPDIVTRYISKNRVDSEGFGEGISQNDFRVDSRYRMDLSNKDWYVYNDNLGTSEEKKFVAYFGTIISRLKEKYSDVYLIRNELFKQLYSFETGEVFYPDFILILKNTLAQPKTKYLVVFVEPKGEHLLQKDSWKGEFLLDIVTNTKPSFQGMPVAKWFTDTDYEIWGTPLYNEEQTKSDFVEYLRRITECI